MLCQNCGKKEATSHFKRIINGEKTESHLCADCAASMGYDTMFSSFGLSFGDLFSSFLGDIPVSRLSSKVLRCEKCGCSFDDIAKNAMVGCADCYKTFYDKLEPTIKRIHGNTNHCGKVPQGAGEEVKTAHKITELKAQLNRAIDEQNFERAAQLRDEIKALEGLK